MTRLLPTNFARQTSQITSRSAAASNFFIPVELLFSRKPGPLPLVGSTRVTLCAVWLILRIRASRFNPAPSLVLVGLSGLEPPTSRLSGVRSNQLSYKPISWWRLIGFRFHLAPSQPTAGGDERDRTVDPLLAKQELSQLSYTPIIFVEGRFPFSPRGSFSRTLKIKQRLDFPLPLVLTLDVKRPSFFLLVSIERR